MMQGQGHNNPQYDPGKSNTPGGVCNGITGGVDEESGIFRRAEDTDPSQSWRWTEQWIRTVPGSSRPGSSNSKHESWVITGSVQFT